MPFGRHWGCFLGVNQTHPWTMQDDLLDNHVIWFVEIDDRYPWLSTVQDVTGCVARPWRNGDQAVNNARGHQATPIRRPGLELVDERRAFHPFHKTYVTASEPFGPSLAFLAPIRAHKYCLSA